MKIHTFWIISFKVEKQRTKILPRFMKPKSFFTIIIMLSTINYEIEADPPNTLRVEDLKTQMSSLTDIHTAYTGTIAILNASHKGRA